MKNAFSSFAYLDDSRKLLLVVLSLAGIGLIMVYSSSAIFAERYWGSPFRFLIRHTAHLCVGGVLLYFGRQFSYLKYKKWIPVLMVSVFLLMLMVLIPGIGTKVSGARRWIRVFGVGIQPSELLKVALIFWTAHFLERKKEYIGMFSRSLLPSFIVLATYLLLLLLQPDFGTAVLLAFSLLLMTLVAGVKPIHIVSSLSALAVIAVTLVATSAYRMRRVTAFLDPWADPLDSGYQLINSLIAYGSGGVLGHGLGDSRQKLLFLPQAHTDFIFAVIGEETGFLGITVILILFLAFMYFGFNVAKQTTDDFGRYTAFGITVLITLQAWIHIGVVIGLLPTKGIGLPFVSYGGSSLIVVLFLSGVLMNIAKSGKG